MKTEQQKKKRQAVHIRESIKPIRRKEKAGFSWRLKAAVLVLCLAIGVFIPVALSWAAPITPNYDWYTNYGTTNVFTIRTPAQLEGLARIVNGDAVINSVSEPARDFTGKTVTLGNSLNCLGGELTPIGRLSGKVFNGTFDGGGYSITSVVIAPGGRTSNIGVFGNAGPNSTLKNVNIGSGASLTVTNSVSGVCISNIGILVGYSEGSIINCTNNGTLTVINTVDQTSGNKFPIMNIGGLAGICLGDITSCINYGTVTVEESGLSDIELEQSIVAVNIGGVVGCAGALDSSIDENTSDIHGYVSGCINNGSLIVNTPNQAGFDRFGNTAFVLSTNVGGVVGYSRGSVSDCQNNAYIRAEHATTCGGVVGSVRSRISSSSYNDNFTNIGKDDGMEEGAEALIVLNCTNIGRVYALACVGGIAGRTGTYVNISGCLNDTSAMVIATRVNKPFPSGIAGACYGTISYCANFGTIASARWDNEVAGTLILQSGFYSAGIVGNTLYFSKTDQETGEQIRITPMPEVYGCINAGHVSAVDNMRQRNITGDNSGYVHDCVAVLGMCYGDKMVYGDDPPNDTESSGGTYANLYKITEAQLKNNDFIDAGLTITPLSVLNTFGDRDGWISYWVKNTGSTPNNGYPALNRQIVATLDITGASVSWKANAQYTGKESAPQATVVFMGNTLTQGIDFKVVPQTGATQVTVGASKLYNARVIGIGNYYGQAIQTFAYGIDRGDLALSTALIDTKTFNWEAQFPSADGVHVYNLAGDEVNPNEYTYKFDANNPNLTGGEAINAKDYYILITAKEESEYFIGSVVGRFNIKQAKIVNDPDPEKLKNNAYVVSISYLGETFDWLSLTIDPNRDDEELPVFEYTGYPIRPQIESIIYLERQLELGRDYRLMYGDAGLMDGVVVPVDKENLGKLGDKGYGYIAARYVAGGNFSNYDNMRFLIEDTAAKNNLSKAVIKDNKGNIIDSNYKVIFEEGSTYTPVEVWFGGSKITEGTDYTVSYTNNDKIGVASFIVTGKGANFEGTQTGTFNIIEGQPYYFTFDNYNNAAKTVTVTGVVYEGSNSVFDMVIPGTTEKDGVVYTVTGIGNSAFGGSSAGDFIGSDANLSKDKIRSVVIPASVVTIGEAAFSSRSNIQWNQIKSVTFDDPANAQLTTIGARAFQGCGNLTEFVFPPKVASIGGNAFNTGSAAKPSMLHTLVFLTQTSNLPSSITATLSFNGVGWDGKEVKVYGYSTATAVKSFATANSGTGSGTHYGRNFKFYQISMHKVTFNTMGGSTVPPVDVIDGFLLKAPVSPTKSGSKFMGWFTSGNGGVTLSAEPFAFASTAITADLTLYAKWQAEGPGAGAPGSGDLDGDGAVTVIEAMTVMRVVSGISVSLTPAQLAAADMDLNGVLTMTDVLLIMRKATLA